MADNPFGFAKIHPDKPGGETWSLQGDPNEDDRLDTDQEIIDNEDGSFRFRDDDSAQMAILTSALFDEGDIVDDHGDLDIDEAGRGYMMDPKDWRDVEIDFNMNVYASTANDGITIRVGGGRHSNPQPFCEGSAYILRLYYNGDMRWEKEQWHNNKIPHQQWGEQAIQGGIEGKWLYGKVTRINRKQNDGSTFVELTFYVNSSGDRKTWNLVSQVTDGGEWGNAGAECNGKPDQILNWAYPMVILNWDNAVRIDWGAICVREIQPTAPLPEDPTDPGQPGTPPEQPTGHVQKVMSFRFPIASVLATSCDGVQPPTPPQDTPTPPNPPGSPPTTGTITIYWSDYFKVGSS